jgi:hypothetical protein
MTMQMISIAKKFFVASLVYFILGLLAQAVAVFDVWLGFNPLAYTAVSATEQLLLLGWLTQFGLALVYNYWFPSLTAGPEFHADPQDSTPSRPPSSGNPPPATRGMVVLVLFNIGLPLVILGQPGLALWGGDWLGAMAAFGGLLQFFAGLLFVRDAWIVMKR